MICPRCYSGSVLEAWDEAPEDAVHWLKCMGCSHRWDAEPGHKGETMPRFNTPEAEERWRQSVKDAAERKRRAKAGLPDKPARAQEAEPERAVVVSRPQSMLSIFDAAIAKVEDDKQILERAREIIGRLNA